MKLDRLALIYTSADRTYNTDGRESKSTPIKSGLKCVLKRAPNNKHTALFCKTKILSLAYPEVSHKAVP